MSHEHFLGPHSTPTAPITCSFSGCAVSNAGHLSDTHSLLSVPSVDVMLPETSEYADPEDWSWLASHHHNVPNLFATEGWHASPTESDWPLLSQKAKGSRLVAILDACICIVLLLLKSQSNDHRETQIYNDANRLQRDANMTRKKRKKRPKNIHLLQLLSWGLVGGAFTCLYQGVCCLIIHSCSRTIHSYIEILFHMSIFKVELILHTEKECNHY